MPSPGELRAHMHQYVDFLHTLQEVDGGLWTAPMGPGKWSMHDVVAHILGWDRNCLEKPLRRFRAGLPTAFAETVDFEAFNRRAVACGRGLSQAGLLREAIQVRGELIRQLDAIPDAAFSEAPGPGLCLAQFLDELFVQHDRHHQEQLRAFLARRPASLP